jgi:hypothetical protein
MKTNIPILSGLSSAFSVRKTLLILFALISTTLLNAQLVVGWDMNGLSAYGASPFAPSNTAAGVTIGGLTRGAGVTTVNTAAANAWGGNGFDGATTEAGAITNNNFVTFTITPNVGSTLSLSNIAAYNIRRSGTGPATGQWQYRINAGAFSNIGTPITWGGTTSATGNLQAAITLSSIPALQNVAGGTTITFRVVTWSSPAAGSTGTWYFNNFTAAASGLDLAVNGTISTTSVPTVSTTAISSILTNAANGGGNVTADGGSSVSARGVVWGTASNPTLPSVNSTSNGTGTGVFSSTISPLIANTNYFARAYATNTIGTAYGNEATFTTLPLAPTATAQTSLSQTSFNVNWVAPTMGAAAYTYTVEVSETNTFAVTVANQSGIASGTTTYAAAGLNPSTDYYYRVRTVNSEGASVWSNVFGPVTTPAPLGPVVATTPALTVTNNAANLQGTIDANGTTANAFFDYGLTVAYGSSVAATPASVTGFGNTTIEFNATGLTPNTLYNYRARANAGIFGVNRTFVTLASVPGAITFGAPTSTSITIASLAVNGNPASTEFAISSPTFAGDYLQFNGTFGPIPFYQTAANWANTIISGLTSSTAYALEAVAQNSEGTSTAFGPTTTSTTLSCASPIVTLNNITNNSVNITILNATGNFEYVVNTSATPPGAAGTAVVGSLVDATGLAASTSYFAHVRSVCGSNFSAWTTSPFTTLANPVGLVTYQFTGCSLCPSSAPTTADAGVTATSYVRGAGINTNAASDVFNNNGFNTTSPSFASAVSQNDYLSFSVTANSGFSVTYSSLSFFHQRSGTGPGNTRVGYSIDGGTNWTYMTPDPVFLTTTATVNWTFPTAFNTSNTVLFRVWAWGATGATGTYRHDNVVLNGYVSALCNNPVTQSTDVVFSNETNVSTDISWTTAGTSDLRKVFISNTASGSPTLVNGTDYLANSNFGSGDAVGAWYCIYSGTGNSTSVSNLLPGNTYRVFVANANCSGIDIKYLNATAVGNPANVVTTNIPTPILSSGPLSNFGTSCINFETESEVIVSGTVLNGTPVTITAPAGYSVSLVSGESYSSSLTLPYVAGEFSTPVYVRFLPTAAIAYNTNLTVTGGGATSITIPVSGNGINTLPTVSTGFASFIGTTGATLSGSLTLGCAPVFSQYGIEYSVSPAFIPGNGAIVQSAFTGNNFSVPVTNLAINTVYYYRAYGVNGGTTYYGTVGSFSTLSGLVETVYNYGDNVSGAPFYVHPTLIGTNVTRSSTGWTNTTACGSGFSGFGLTSAATTFNAATNAYVEVNLTPNVLGNQVEVERISVQLRSSSNGANRVMLAYSIDEGATWTNRGVAEVPAINSTCGVTSSNSWLLSSPVTVGSPLAASSLKIRLYYYNTSGLTGGNNQILNLVVLGRILQSPSTYYTVSGGNFSDAIWSPLPSGTVGAAVDFTPEISAVINSGDNVVLTTSDVLVNNLTIETGANLQAASTNFSAMRNVSIYGNLSVSGSIGNGVTFDAIGLNIEGPNVIISGNGAINVGRIRKQSNFFDASNLLIQSNVNVLFPGAAVYNNAPNSIFNITLNAGRTLNVTGSGGTNGNVAMDGPSGNDVDQKGGSLVINGTLNINGDLSISSSNNINPYISNLTINPTGVVSVIDIDTKVSAVNTVVINAGGRLNVSGVMRHRQGTLTTNNGLTLGVGAILLHGAGTPGISPDPGGLISGNITVRAQGTTASGMYNYWSSPVLNNAMLSIMQNGASSGSFQNTYRYNAVNASSTTVEGLRDGWENQTSSDVMQPAVGYITTTAGSVQFAGTPNNGNISVPAIHGTFTDFNLVGNPYPGPLDAAVFISANQASNIIPAIYFWDDDASLGVDYANNDYIVTNPVGTVGTGGNGGAAAYNGRIATGQSFFVETRPAATTVTFSNSMRTTGSATFFQAPSDFAKLWLRVTGDNNLSNEALLAFGEQATDGYDDLYDAKKIAASQNIALYTSAGDLNFAIQAMSALTTSKIVPVGFDAALAGNYSFSIANIEGIDPSVVVYLEDRQEGVFHNLRLSNYDLAVGSAINGSERFFLHFSSPIEVSAIAETCNSNDGSIEVAANELAWSYVLKTANNVPVANGFVANTAQTIANLSSGVYLLEFSLDGYTATKTIEVMASAPVQAAVSGTSNVSVNELATFTSISTGATSISWNFGDGSSDVIGNVVDHTFLSPGIYVVTLTVSNNVCVSQSTFEVVVDQDVTGLSDVSVNDIRLFPNPANESVTLVSDGKGFVQVVDMNGRLITTQALNSERVVSLSTSALSNGVYLVQLIHDGSIATRRLVVAH